MARAKHSEEKIIYELDEAEGGKAIKEILRQMAVSVNMFYQWEKKYSVVGVSEVLRLRQLENETKFAAAVTVDRPTFQL